MNKNELFAVMKKYGDTQETLSKAMGISRVTLNKKINENKNNGFNQSEINFIINRYSLTAENVKTIFFD